VPPAELPRYRRALAALAASGMILPESERMALVDEFQYGLDAPICLTWELTTPATCPACTACRPRAARSAELDTAQCRALIDEFERMQVFY